MSCALLGLELEILVAFVERHTQNLTLATSGCGELTWVSCVAMRDLKPDPKTQA